MDILICQGCGVILRSKGKNCSACGMVISRHSPTTLPVISHTGAPLAVNVAPDPLVLEKALNRYQYRNIYRQNSYAGAGDSMGGNGHGNGNGYGGWGTAVQTVAAPPAPSQHDFAKGRTVEPPAAEPAEAASAALPAADAAQSRLSSLLGSAASFTPDKPASGNQDVVGMLSLDPIIRHLQEEGSAEEELPTVQDGASAVLPEAEMRTAADHQAQQSGRRTASGGAAAASFAAGAAAATFASAASSTRKPKPSQPAPAAVPQSATIVADAASSIAITAAVPVVPAITVAAAAQPITAKPQPEASIRQSQSQSDPPAVDKPLDGSVEQTAAFGPDRAHHSPANGGQTAFEEHGAFPGRPAASLVPINAGLAQQPPAQNSLSLDEPPQLSRQEQAAALAINAVMFQQPPASQTPAISAASDFFSDAPASAAQAPISGGTGDTMPASALSVNSEPALQTSANNAADAALSAGRESRPEEPAAGQEETESREKPLPADSAAAKTPSAGTSGGSFFDSAPGAGDFFSAGGGGSAAQTTFAAGFFDNGATAQAPPQPVLVESKNEMNGKPSIIAEAMARAQAAAQSAAQDPERDDAREDEYPDESVNRGKGKAAALADDQESSQGSSESETEDDTDRKPKRKPRLEDRVNNADEKKLNVFGFEMTAKSAMTAAILLFMVAVPVLGVLSTIFSGVGGSLGQGMGNLAASLKTTKVPPISGQWATVTGSDQGSFEGRLHLLQQGVKIGGKGQDKFGSFIIQGAYKDNKVEFVKQYIGPNGQPAGKPISCVGLVAQAPEGQAPGVIDGVYSYQKRVGYGWRGQIVDFKGQWRAQLVQPYSEDVVAAATMGGSIQTAATGAGTEVKVQQPQDPKKMHDFFLKVALCIIGGGAVLAVLSLKMFGPAGMINIWAKKNYIPSQYKSQHFKILNVLGKPLKPGGLPLGSRVEWNITQFYRPRVLALPPDMRETNPHVLLLGAGAKGKSRLMASMVAHDIASNDRAVVVIDSDGGLVDLLVNWIAAHPKGREMARRVIVIDPTRGDDSEKLAYNPLEFPADGDLQNAASAVVFGFKAIYTEPPGSQSQWNQQTANILRNAAVLLMANGKTLTDLPTLLAENDFRDVLLEKVERMKEQRAEYITLIDAWNNYKRLARTDQWLNWIEPILNRVQPMLGDPRIRPILTKPKGDLILRDIITEGKTLLVKIPQGQLDQNANLLGSLIVSGLKQAALGLSLKDVSKRHPCALYLDEMDTFIEKETFDALTSETKKFQIGFIAAAKTLQGLPEDYRNQIVINSGTIAVFALAKKDGDLLGPQMFRVDGRKIKHQTIQNVFNKVNTSPQFELVADEEKINIDRVVGQEDRTYFCYRVGTVAGVFNLRTPDFNDVPEKSVNYDLVKLMYSNRPERRDKKDTQEKKDKKESREKEESAV